MSVIADWNWIPAEIKSRPGTAWFKAEYKGVRARTIHLLNME
jgi:hypothetical protein